MGRVDQSYVKPRSRAMATAWTRLRTARLSRVMSRPNIRAFPPVGRVRPRSILIVVLLPAPLGPRNPKIEFLGTCRMSPSNAFTPLKALLYPCV
jgi:hypothetical protein